MKLHSRFTIFILLSALVPLLMAMGSFVFYILQYSGKQTVNLAAANLHIGAGQISSFLSGRVSEIETYSSIPVIKTMNFKKIDTYLKKELALHSDIYEKFIIGNRDGNFYNTSGGNPFKYGLRTFKDTYPYSQLRSISNRDYWKKTVIDNTENKHISFVSDPMISYTTDARQIVIASSIISDSDKVVGMIGGAITWGTIEKKIEELK